MPDIKTPLGNITIKTGGTNVALIALGVAAAGAGGYMIYKKFTGNSGQVLTSKTVNVKIKKLTGGSSDDIYGPYYVDLKPNNGLSANPTKEYYERGEEITVLAKTTMDNWMASPKYFIINGARYEIDYSKQTRATAQKVTGPTGVEYYIWGSKSGNNKAWVSFHALENTHIDCEHSFVISAKYNANELLVEPIYTLSTPPAFAENEDVNLKISYTITRDSRPMPFQGWWSVLRIRDLDTNEIIWQRQLGDWGILNDPTQQVGHGDWPGYGDFEDEIIANIGSYTFEDNTTEIVKRFRAEVVAGETIVG